MKIMKQALTTILVILLLAALPIQRAQAIVGIILGNPVIMLAGLVPAGIGVAYDISSPHPDAKLETLAFLTALVFLNGQNGRDVAFSPIQSASEAHKLGLSDSELTAYNRELDTLNLIREQVESQLTSAGGDRESARAVWTKYQNLLSPEAYSAAQKIATRAIGK